MAKEIERKFLTTSEDYKAQADKVTHITQGYLSTLPNATVRVRIRDNEAFLTVKGRNRGIERDEWEYSIPVGDAEEMLKRCGQAIIEKNRYNVGRWEIDEFLGKLAGLTVAEIELSSADETVTLPDFIGKEVTGDPRYYNSTLSHSKFVPLKKD